MFVSLFSIGRFHHFDLARQITRLGHELSLFTSNPRSRVDLDLHPYVRIRPRFRLPYALGCRLGLTAELYWLDELLLKDLGVWMERSVDREWTDVYHAQDGAGPGAGLRVKASGKVWICDRGSTHILAQRNLLVEEHKAWNAPPPQISRGRIERSIAEYEQAHALTVPSQFVKRSFVEYGISAARIHVCPYGVDTTEFRPAVKRDSVFRVLHVGQISIRKGIGYLLEALQPMVMKGKCELWLVGEIDSAVRRLLGQYKGAFEWKGICPRKDLWKLYSQASVLVLASVEEGLALVQAQAMACGIPVIATTNTGAEDLFTNGVEGFIVPIRNAEALRAKVEWMMDGEEKRKEMAAAALRRVREMGGWMQYGEAMEGVYQKVMADVGVTQHDELLAMASSAQSAYRTERACGVQS